MQLLAAAHKPSRKWTPEEDEILIEVLEKQGPKNWKLIAELFSERSPTKRASVQCLQRWRKVLQPGLKKGKWSAEEDAILLAQVQEAMATSGVVRWPRISQHIPGRTSKQCRERWKCNLDPSIVRDTFSADEDALILHYQSRFGNRWALIAHNLPGRTENAVKARCLFLQRQRAGGSDATAAAAAATAVTSDSDDEEEEQDMENVSSSVLLGEAITATTRFELPNDFYQLQQQYYDISARAQHTSFSAENTATTSTTTQSDMLDFPTPVAELDRFFKST